MSPSATRAAFDAHAPTYAQGWDNDPVGAAQRRRIQELLLKTFPRGGRVLDLGCGPGVDSAWLAGRGHTVDAVDQSQAMLEQAETRCAGLPVTLHLGDLRDPPNGPFDAALSNFGAINCLDSLEPFATRLHQVLRPRGIAVLVLMPRVAPAEWIAGLMRLRPRLALRRLREVGDVAGHSVHIRYPSTREVHRAFSSRFAVVARRGLGVALPPPRSGHPYLLPALDRADRVVGSWPLFRRCGDHTVWVLRRR